MAKIWTNYNTSDHIEFIDLTALEKETQNMTYKREDKDIPILNHRQTAIVKYVWSLHREEKDWLSAFFLNKVRASKFFDLVSTDKREFLRLKVSYYDLVVNFANGNLEYFKRVLEDEGDFWLVVSCRINYKSNFYECLVKRVFELNEAEERAIEL